MSDGLPPGIAEALAGGSFCHVGVMSPSGPHLTPTVFALSDGRLWITTSRGSVKARAWVSDPRVAGLVRDRERAVAITGRVTTYDLLDPSTWMRSLADAPTVAAASARFTRKNARFFAGYAVDAHHVPLAWTPPGRVFAAIGIERAVSVGGGVRELSGSWGERSTTHERFRAARAGLDALASVPDEVRVPLGASGPAALAVEGADGVVVLPAGWVADGPMLIAALPGDVLALSGGKLPTVPVALGMDRPSSWRARQMIGAMVRGTGEVYALDRLVSGSRSAASWAQRAGIDPSGATIVRIRPRRVVWWRGWSSGTAVLS
jgi:hypothetical protein